MYIVATGMEGGSNTTCSSHGPRVWKWARYIWVMLLQLKYTIKIIYAKSLLIYVITASPTVWLRLFYHYYQLCTVVYNHPKSDWSKRGYEDLISWPDGPADGVGLEAASHPPSALVNLNRKFILKNERVVNDSLKIRKTIHLCSVVEQEPVRAGLFGRSRKNRPAPAMLYDCFFPKNATTKT